MLMRIRRLREIRSLERHTRRASPLPQPAMMLREGRPDASDIRRDVVMMLMSCRAGRTWLSLAQVQVLKWRTPAPLQLRHSP
jgi:hypothetical protein